jgi:NAD-dependent deacetylase
MAIRRAAELLRQARRAVAFTGAGFSTPSGIPDFRSDEHGLWNHYDPMEVASLTAFRTHPERFFAWIHPLAQTILDAQPNAAHYAFAALEQASLLRTVITQNIDGLHQRAGSSDVVEVHGSLEGLTCVNCFKQQPAAAFVAAFVADKQIPRCPECGAILKPNAILFEEQLPRAAWNAAQQAASQADLLIVAGSSLEVMPVAGLPMRALEAGARLIVINHSPTYIDSRADVVLETDVAEALPQIMDLLQTA